MSRGFGSTFGAGSTDVITAGYKSSGSDKRSYSVWYYRHGAGGSSRGAIFDKGSGANSSEQLDYNAGTFNFNRKNASNVTTCSTNITLTAAGVADTWIHTLLVHDQSSGTNTVQNMWFNGASFTSSQTIGAFVNVASDNTTAYLIGNNGAGTRNWDGLLAHFAIWDDIILDRSAAISLTNGAHPLSIASQNLVCYMPLDGIHDPEIDFIFANGGGSSSITGAKFGTTQPAAAPMYIATNNIIRPNVFGDFVPAITSGPMVTMLW